MGRQHYNVKHTDTGISGGAGDTDLDELDTILRFQNFRKIRNSEIFENVKFSFFLLSMISGSSAFTALHDLRAG